MPPGRKADMQTHQKKPDPEPLAMIRSGTETMELRLYDG